MWLEVMINLLAAAATVANTVGSIVAARRTRSGKDREDKAGLEE